jgi:gas vesicle protein
MRPRAIRTTAAGLLGAAVILLAPACSSNTRDDLKKTGSDLSTDAVGHASDLSSNLSSLSNSVSSGN